MSGSVIVSSFRNVCFVINAALEAKFLHGCGRPLPQRKESSPVYDATKCRGNPDRTGGIGTGRQRPPDIARVQDRRLLAATKKRGHRGRPLVVRTRLARFNTDRAAATKKETAFQAPIHRT